MFAKFHRKLFITVGSSSRADHLIRFLLPLCSTGLNHVNIRRSPSANLFVRCHSFSDDSSDDVCILISECSNTNVRHCRSHKQIASILCKSSCEVKLPPNPDVANEHSSNVALYTVETVIATHSHNAYSNLEWLSFQRTKGCLQLQWQAPRYSREEARRRSKKRYFYFVLAYLLSIWIF